MRPLSDPVRFRGKQPLVLLLPFSTVCCLLAFFFFFLFLVINGTLVSFLKVKVHPWVSSGIIYPHQLRWQPVAAAAAVAAGRRPTVAVPAVATAAAAAG